jgi:hypothetical protein
MAEMLSEKQYDDGKNQSQDEIAWLSFETRMRHLMRKVLEPVISMCVEDRESMFEIEIKEADQMKRLELIEAAVF